MTCADKIAEALAALEELANMPLGISLADWSRLSSPILEALREQALADLADAQAQENAELRAENERLRKMMQPEWFYAADGYESEACRWSVGEVLNEDYFSDLPKTGQHVVEINVATALPSIWAAVRFNCTCPDPDDCECDNDMIVTEHASEAEARAALGDTP